MVGPHPSEQGGASALGKEEPPVRNESEGGAGPRAEGAAPGRRRRRRKTPFQDRMKSIWTYLLAKGKELKDAEPSLAVIACSWATRLFGAGWWVSAWLGIAATASMTAYTGTMVGALAVVAIGIGIWVHEWATWVISIAVSAQAIVTTTLVTLEWTFLA